MEKDLFLEKLNRLPIGCLYILNAVGFAFDVKSGRIVDFDLEGWEE